MSGLITLTLKESGPVPQHTTLRRRTDELHQLRPQRLLQIKDASGNLIDFAGAGKSLCRNDHRYEFLVNDAYPPAWELHGKATAYITLQPGPRYWTVSGSFTLTVRGAAAPRRGRDVQGLGEEGVSGERGGPAPR